MGFSGSPIVAVNIKDLNPVTLVPGTTVGVSPQLWQSWPCVTGEPYAPSFGSANYGRILGQNAVTLTGAGSAFATWAYITRYSPYGSSYYLQVRFLTYIPALTAATGQCVGFGNGAGSAAATLSGIRIGPAQDQPTKVGLWLGNFAGVSPNNNFTIPAGLDMSAYTNQLVSVELLYADTMTRVTINGDTSLRLTSAPLPPGVDNGLFRLGYYAQGGWTGSWSAATAPAISQLFMNYISQVPA